MVSNKNSGKIHTTRDRNINHIIAPILVMILAVALRFYRLGDESLWADEGCSLLDAERIRWLEGYRPAYYFILRGWMELGLGGNEFLLRIPAALFSAVSVWLTYVIGTRMMGRQVGLLAAVFMAISTLQINHAQEVRMYSLVAMMSLVTTYILMQWRDNGGIKYAPAYFLSTMILLLAFPLSVFVPMAHGLYVLLYQRSSRRLVFPFILTGLITALAWSPWLMRNMCGAKVFNEGYIASMDKPTLLSAVRYMGDFFLWKVGGSSGMFVLASIIFSVGVVLSALYGLRGYRRSDTNLSLAWLWLLVPVLGTIAICFKVTNMWMVRYLIAASPALYLLVAKGILSINNRYLASTAALLIVIVSLARLGLYYEKPVRAEWRPAVEYLQAHEQPGDVIGIYSPGNKLIFEYYYHGDSKWAPMGEYLTFDEQFSKWNEPRAARFFKEYPHSGKRFWLMLSKHTFRGGFSIINYVEKHYRVIEHRKYNDLEVYLFETTEEPVAERSAGNGGSVSWQRN